MEKNGCSFRETPKTKTPTANRCYHSSYLLLQWGKIVQLIN